MAEVMLERASAAWAMRAQPIGTPTALALKCGAERDWGASILIDLQLPGGLTVVDAIERDIPWIAQREIGGAAADELISRLLPTA